MDPQAWTMTVKQQKVQSVNLLHLVKKVYPSSVSQLRKARCLAGRARCALQPRACIQTQRGRHRVHPAIRKPDETPFQQLRLQASSLEMSLQCGLITVSKLIVLTSGFTGERARPLARADAARARRAARSGWREYTDGMKEHQSRCARCLASNRNTVVGVKVLDVLLPLSPLSRV